MNTTYPRLRGLAGRRAGRVCALLVCMGALAACAIDGPAPPSSTPSTQIQPAPADAGATPAAGAAGKRPAPTTTAPSAPSPATPKASEAAPAKPPAVAP